MKSLQCRTILWHLVFSGMIVFILHYININIAIIAMVEQHGAEVVEKHAECAGVMLLSNATREIKVQVSRTFDWSEMEQALILGAPYWFFCAFILPASMVVNRVGAKIMLGWSNLAQALLALVSPIAAYQSLTWFFVVRALTGMFSAFGFTVLPTIAAEWIPPNERSHFMTCYIASAIAIAVGYPIFGWVSEVFGWEYIFYGSGVVTCLWFIFWQALMYDTPRQHPRITSEERDFILDSLVDQSQEVLPIPWKKMLLSSQVWLICFANSGYGFIFMIFATYAPAYFKNIYGMDIKSSAALASIPHIIRMCIALFVGRVADNLISSGKISKVNVRKFATATCTLGAGIAFLFLAFTGCNLIIATLLIGIVIASSAFPNAGFFAAVVDLAPNFAAMLFAMGQTCSGLCQVAATIFVGYITDGNQTYDQWQKVFITTALIGIIPGLVYIIFGQIDVLPWNNSDKVTTAEERIELKNPNLTRVKRQRTESSASGFGSIILS